MSSLAGQRIQANCKIIWGDHNDYEFDVETDDNLNYAGYVKVDYGFSFGPPLTMTSLCPSNEAAWAELERMLELWATQVKRGTPMTGDDMLEIFGGRRGEHKRILGMFMDAVEKREEEGAKKPA